jgi:hypothetical protein
VARSVFARLIGGTFLAGLASAIAWGCAVNLSGLSGGDDGGTDGTSSRDGTTDGKGPPKDGGGDGSTDHDAKMGDSSGGEACVPIPADGGASPACPADGSASCAPQPASGYMPGYVPPRPTLSVCTAAQISTFTGNCFNDGDAGTCATFEDDAKNATCISCLISPGLTSEKEWGPILTVTGLSELNIGGCVALLDPCQTACAAAIEEQTECQTYACGGCLPMGDTIFDDCVDEAVTCLCKGVSKAYESCQTELVGSPAAKCFPISSFVQGATTLAQIFCGGG